jgi:hypothetical protein
LFIFQSRHSHSNLSDPTVKKCASLFVISAIFASLCEKRFFNINLQSVASERYAQAPQIACLFYTHSDRMRAHIILLHRLSSLNA